jgi:two-component system, NtrC family, response regulator AtoC
VALQSVPSTRTYFARAVSGYELVVIGTRGMQRVALPKKGRVEIGRDATAEIHIDSPQISRRHAALEIDNGKLSILDLGSSNGTIVREKPLEPKVRAELALGEVVHMGDFVLLVSPRHDEKAEAAPAVPELPDDVIVAAPAMRALYHDLAQAAHSDLAVLILGETGVGKDVVARCLHHLSPRRTGPFLRLNCAALPEALLESELFGHERGAFTGAVQTKVGLLESATGGTVFLDEIGELPINVQAKLLHALEVSEITRVGSVRGTKIDVRFVAATNRDLEIDIRENRFRSDLFYRLAVYSLLVPPLRERRAEVMPLARDMVRRAAERAGTPIPAFDSLATAMLVDYGWPGNVRELRNVIERAYLQSRGDEIGISHLKLGAGLAGGSGVSSGGHIPVVAAASVVPDLQLTADELAERERIIEVLVRCHGNQSRAATELGISRGTLLVRLDAYRISRPRKRPIVPR